MIETRSKIGHSIRMLAHVLKRYRGLMVVAALVIALVATGFGHRAPSVNDTAMEAYVLAGGSLVDLCLDASGDRTAHHEDCPMCNIVGSALIPDAFVTLRDADLIFVARVIAPRESRAVRVVLDPALGMRAPPVA